MKIYDDMVFEQLKDSDNLFFRVGSRIYALSSWKSDFALMEWNGKRFHASRDNMGIRLFFGHYESIKASTAREKFVNNIPQEAQKEAEKYRWLQLTILRMMRLTQDTIDLARTNPVLLWLLANEINRGSLLFSAYIKLIRQRQKNIVKEFWGDNSVSLGLIKRINPKEYTFNEFDVVLRIVNDKNVALSLMHYSKIYLKTLSMVRFDFDLIRCLFFRKLIEKGESDIVTLNRAIEIFRDGTRAALGAGCRHYNEIFTRVDSLESAIKVYDRWIDNYQDSNQFEFYMKKENGFIEPIISGNDDIVLIKSVKELMDEGVEMNNCIGSYVKELYRRDMYFYKVLNPERCSLAISIFGKKVYIVDFRDKYNEKPGYTVRNTVKKWIRDNGFIVGEVYKSR